MIELNHIIYYITIGILIYFFILASWYLIALIYSSPKIIKIFKEIEYGNISELISNNLIPISITIPSYNSGKKILNALSSIFHNTYKNVQIIIVSDGSTDNTLEILKNEFELYEIPPMVKDIVKTAPIKHLYQSKKKPNLFVVDKEHGPANNGADNNNTGLNVAKFPLFMTIDDDTVLEPNALSLLLYSFLSQSNTVSVGGALRVLNENHVQDGKLLSKKMPNSYVAAVQSMEYLRSFTYGRASLDISVGGAMCFPGAFSLFETKMLKEIGGYDTYNPGYDAEIVIKIQHLMRQKNYPTNVHFMSGSFAWTEVPATFKSYWSQRSRWQLGMLRSAFKHITMLFNPKYGFVGLISFPAFIFFEIFGPVIEFISYLLLLLAICTSAISWNITFLFLFLAWGYFVLITILSYLLDYLTFHSYKCTSIFRLIYLVTLEMMGLRQFRALCCTYGTLNFFFKSIFGNKLKGN